MICYVFKYITFINLIEYIENKYIIIKNIILEMYLNDNQRNLVLNFSDQSVTSIEMITLPSIFEGNLSFQNQSHCFPQRVKSIRRSRYLFLRRGISIDRKKSKKTRRSFTKGKREIVARKERGESVIYPFFGLEETSI